MLAFNGSGSCGSCGTPAGGFLFSLQLGLYFLRLCKIFPSLFHPRHKHFFLTQRGILYFFKHNTYRRDIIITPVACLQYKVWPPDYVLSNPSCCNSNPYHDIKGTLTRDILAFFIIFNIKSVFIGVRWRFLNFSFAWSI